MNNIIAEIEKLFEDLLETPAIGKKIVFQNIEQSIYLLKQTIIDDTYALEQCTKFIICCKNLSRKRQPKGFSQSNEVSAAYGYLSILKDRSKNEAII